MYELLNTLKDIIEKCIPIIVEHIIWIDEMFNGVMV